MPEEQCCRLVAFLLRIDHYKSYQEGKLTSSQTFSNGSLSMMYTGRLIAGLGTGSITVIVPLYIAELSPPSIRGRLVGVYEIQNQLSSVMGYWVNYIVNESIPATSAKQWRVSLAMQIIPSSLLFLAALFVLPESPRYLLSKGETERASKVLAWVRDAPEDDVILMQELREISEAIEMQNAVKAEQGAGKNALGRFLGLFKELLWKGNRRRFAIGIGLMVGQNATGMYSFHSSRPTSKNKQLEQHIRVWSC